MGIFDIGIGWASPYERAFTRILRDTARRNKKKFREITFSTLPDDYRAIINGSLRFKLYLDRGSIDEAGFAFLAKTLAERGTHVINNPDAVTLSSSKGALYPKILAEGIPLPKTFIVNKKTHRKDFDRMAHSLKAPFVITSSYGAGNSSDQILLTGSNGDDIYNFVKSNFEDTFVVHEYVRPILLNGKIAWFRPIYVCGTVVPLWWDPMNHYYEIFGDSRNERGLQKTLEKYVMKIANITGFELFSSEFAMIENNAIILVDYANNPIDLDSSNNISGGLPPEILLNIAEILI